MSLGPDNVLRLTVEHLALTAAALTVAVVTAIPIALVLWRHRRACALMQAVLSAVYTVPSLAMIILFMPLFGLNARSVVAALILYNEVILLRAGIAALRSVDPAALAAAEAMGLTFWQRWWRVQLPLALPVLLAGVRLAAITSVGVAAIGAKFGAGGLGQLLFAGIAQAGRMDKLLLGASALAVLALTLDLLLRFVGKRWAPGRR